MDFTNAKVAKMLEDVAAALTIKKGNLFQIRAYQEASASIEHLTSEVKDLWEEEKLDDIPGVGESIKAHFEELFKTGKVKHWEDVEKSIPEEVFEFLTIPGVGPKTAQELAKLGVKDKKDLINKLRNDELIKKGFSEKIAKKIADSLKRQPTEEQKSRILLPFAFAHAQKILDYLLKNSEILQAEALGSLRRMVATVGDLDFAIASKNPRKVVDYIIKMPWVERVVEQGETKAIVVFSSGLQLDFIVTNPDHFGALLQHFTGSKAHNIHLRTLAEKKGLSLSEYGVKEVASGKVHETETEEEFYELLNMQTPPPELREDTGEIEAALKYKLPHLVKLEDIKGDFHIHSDLIKEPSHDIGANSIEEIVKEAKRLGYDYIGISDHQPSQSNHTKEQMIKILQERKSIIEHINYSNSIRVLNLLEVDILPDGSLGVPDEALKMLDFALAGVHSSHHQSKEQMTKRILKALGNPYVKILTHPTNRLLNEREASDADWEEIFRFAAKNKKALEINAFPDRLDLPDLMVKMALSFGVKFTLGTDSHQISSMENMRFGVAVARRGWASKEDIINTWDWKKLTQWFNI
ncbi:MAG: DNA polymerase/3'-5' exonuclease PolX [Candidatus Daviesbacteria bacterium]